LLLHGGCAPGALAARPRRADLLREEPTMSSMQPPKVRAYREPAPDAGLTEPLVLRVIAAFYEKVRRDPVLGPVFEAAIGRDWPAHMQRINLFWLTVTRLGQGYPAGRFMPAHLHNPSIRAEQLPRWLALFRATATELCEPAAAAVLIDIAERMAESIRLGLERRDGAAAV
jgi:hemoglobin